MTASRDTLYVAPLLRVQTTSGGKVVLTRKFIDGINYYVDRWPGPITVIAEHSNKPDQNLDHVEIDPSELRFGVKIVSFNDHAKLGELFKDARLVLGSLDPQQTGWAWVCKRMGVPIIYVAEYSIRTRKQIIRANHLNPLKRWVRYRQVDGSEDACVKAAPVATGIQCNGTPTYEDYAPLNPRTLLYFDTRTSADMLASDEELAVRTNELLAGGPLRLAFSGRLIAMKGVQYLPAVAAELAKRKVPFTFDICGGGDLQPSIESKMKSLGLADRVRFPGVLKFHDELMPMLRRNIDLFVCPHPQGDPSCTYLETMACGVPIAGFDNEAFRGVVDVSHIGWLAPMGNPIALAAVIADLNAQRQSLVLAATASRDFAAKHTFEKTFDVRIQHMLECAAQPVAVGT